LPAPGIPPGPGSLAGAPDNQPSTSVAAVPAKVDNATARDQPSAASPSTANIYIPSPTGTPFRQGEILTGIYQHRRSLASLKCRTHELEEIQHPYAVVMSPDCDLEQDFSERMHPSKKEGQSEKLIPGILLLEAMTADELRSTTPPGKDIWKRIRQNKDERYHVLEAVPNKSDAEGSGLPPLGIDFKRYFTVPTDELHEQCATTSKRRCYMESPFAEHINRRFTDFLSRVALPREHQVE
jgi:hypothetical protein